MTATALITAYLAAQRRAIAAGEQELLTTQTTVHPVRVATRRARSTLKTFGRLMDSGEVGKLDIELAWFAGLLGDVRDRQVQRRRFADVLHELPPEQILGPVAAHLEEHLLSEQLHHTRALTDAVRSPRYQALAALLDTWAASPPFVRPVHRRDLRSAVARSRRKTRKRLAAGLAGSDEELHRARKSAKRTRYAAELAAPVLKKPKDRRAADRHERLQTVLGEHQDSVVAADLLRQLASGTANSTDQNGFTYGLLFQREMQQSKKSREAAAAWRP